MALKTHNTHKMRSSDSSYYDEICDACGQPDFCNRDNPKLGLPCSALTYSTVSFSNEFFDAIMKYGDMTHKDLTEEMKQSIANAAIKGMMENWIDEPHYFYDDYVSDLVNKKEIK